MAQQIKNTVKKQAVINSYNKRKQNYKMIIYKSKLYVYNIWKIKIFT